MSKIIILIPPPHLVRIRKIHIVIVAWAHYSF
nr:MAG TPA: hypothetical protein [Caudoviricetes sp.]